MSNIILPDDPRWNEPITMDDPYKKGLTPKTAAEKRNRELDEMREKENPNMNWKYGNSTIAHAPDAFMKFAQMTGVSNMMTNPMWFSPLHTPQNWQIASKRREIYQWSFIDTKNPCYLSNYGDFSLIHIKNVYTKWQNDFAFRNQLYIQNDTGEKAKPDICTKRYAKKKANCLKILGMPHSLEITHDHKCIIIKKENVKCHKHTTKNCIHGVYTPTCIRSKCNKYQSVEYEISTVNAEDVRKGDYVLCSFPTEIKDSIIKTKEQARFAGHLASDGSVSQNRPGTRIFMHPDEEEYVLDSVSPVFQSFDAPINPKLASDGSLVATVRSGKKSLHKFASQIVKNTSAEKKYTSEVMLLDPELQKHVLGAYIQSDGTFNKVNEQIEITTISKHLANQLQLMCYRCDVMAFCSQQPISSSNKTFATSVTHRYIISIPKTYIHILREYVPGKIPECIYKPEELQDGTTIFAKNNSKTIRRIHNRFFWKNYVVTPVVSNTSFDYEGPVYDIRVPPSYTITANGVAIHQCRFFYENEPKVAAAIDFYCFTPDTQVLMADGHQKSISSIKPGDRVRSHNRTINPVVRVFTRRSKEQILSITIKGSRKLLKTTPDHEMFTIKNGVAIKVRAKCFKVGHSFLFWDKDRFISREIINITVKTYEGLLYDMEVENAHSYVANGIACSNSRFPMNGFKLECKDKKILNWFHHHVVRRLKLNDMLKMISSEYFMLGDVFVHLDIDCPICKGSAVDPDTGEQCNHPGGSFKRMLILNPDWIEVQQSILADEPQIVMIPDEELKRIIFYKQPKPIYDRIPDNVKKLVLQNRPIPLSNRTLSHMKHMPVPYGTYGTSLIRRLFTTLAYKTKIMTANWIVAERLILPVRVVKIGSDNRPASSADIADIQTQLAQTANDPNLTIVTHHNFEYEWYGAVGKILQVTQEMENIGKEILDGFMLNQSLLNGEMSGYQCHDEKTEVLTPAGWMLFNDAIHEEIAVYDSVKKMSFFEKPIDYHIYDYDDEMICFNGRYLDIKVTPNHKMLVKSRNGTAYTKYAKDVVWGDHFISVGAFADNADEYEDETYIDCLGHYVDTEQFMKYLGYYISEGFTTYNESSYRYWTTVSQSSVINASICNDMRVAANSIYDNVHEYCRESGMVDFTVCDKTFCKWMHDQFGSNSHTKFLPLWVKQYSPKYLRILLDSMVEGDGTTQLFANSKWIRYRTVSEQLANDVQEIAFKCGFNPQKTYMNNIYNVSWTDGINGKSPKIKTHHISKKHYQGKVWCFTTSTGFFITRRNGKISIHGNSAQVGVETLIRRIESWRGSLGEWIEENIFKPIAEMQGFIDEKASNELGESVFLYPEIKWNDLDLKDKNQWYQLLNSLHDKQVISTQTLLEEMDLDYDQEVQRMRYEMTQAGPAGGGLGAGGQMAPGMGGGAPGGDMADGMGGPGMGMGGPGMGMGGDIGGGMGMGGGMAGGVGSGGMPGGGMGGMAGGAKVMKKGKTKDRQADQEMMAEAMPMIKLTSIEQDMAQMLERVGSALGWTGSQIYERIRLQFPVQNPKGNKPYMLDFALPHYQLGIESDGDYFHNRPEQIQSDQERDHLLAQRGWTILRFDDKTIGESPQKVESTIMSYIRKAMDSRKAKTASKKEASAHLFTIHKGEMVDLHDQYTKYVKQRYSISNTARSDWEDVKYKNNTGPTEIYR